VCQAIVKAHGGTIFAKNRSDGQGAIFTFVLPMEGSPPEIEKQIALEAAPYFPE
jgi:K+-sensing histidine kinase KdpD